MGENLRQHHSPLQRRLGQRISLQHQVLRDLERAGRPDAGMWTGTQQQYFELYEVAAKAIKAHDPSLKVGGPAACGIDHPIVRPFLAYCRDRKLPLDFFAWHCYHRLAAGIFARHAAMARALLDEYGFKKRGKPYHRMALGANFEWELLAAVQHDRRPRIHRSTPTCGRRWADMRGPKGAAFAASVLMLLQDSSPGDGQSLHGRHVALGHVRRVRHSRKSLLRLPGVQSTD